MKFISYLVTPPAEMEEDKHLDGRHAIEEAMSKSCRILPGNN
jgi:hypothetical protein